MKSSNQLRRGLALACTVALLSGCPNDPVSSDAGGIPASDAGFTDSGIIDASSSDAGEVADAGVIDSGAPPTELAWSLDLPNNAYGSPRLFESEDGPEMLLSFGAVFGSAGPDAVLGGAMSINASTGAVSWQVDRDAELFSLAIPVESHSGLDNLYLFGGKRGVLMAIDAETGIMHYQAEPYGDASREAGIWNYYTGLQAQDINADGVGEIVITNGGDDAADIGDPRPPGWLEVLDGVTLSAIHRIPVPAAAETYLSPTLWVRQGVAYVVYGTGGETLPGSLFMVPMQSVLAGTLDDQVELVAPIGNYGFIAPPAYADLDDDGALDMIVSPYDGRLIVLSGATAEVLWMRDREDERETAASPILGDFDGDGDLDIFTSLTQGTFPMWRGSEIRVFDGRTGNVLFEDSVAGEILIGTAVAADVDEDQIDEILFARSTVAENFTDPVWSELSILHTEEGRVQVIGEQEGLVGSAGWVGDADGDGYLEWYLTSNGYDVSRLVRYNLSGRTPQRIAWGGYFGTRHDGKY